MIVVQPPTTRVDPRQKPDPMYGADFIPEWTRTDIVPPYPLYTIRQSSLWLYAIESAGERYYASSEATGRSRPLRSLKPGDKVRLAVERGHVYVVDSAGQEHSLKRLPSQQVISQPVR